MIRRVFTGFVGALAEAAQEVRVHRGRILLSLVGVAVAITAMVGSMAASGLVGQAMREQAESGSGRPVMLQLSLSQAQTPTIDKINEIEALWTSTLERSEINYSTVRGQAEMELRLPDGAVTTYAEIIDQPFAEMFRIRMTEGVWFQPGDEERLAPAVVINSALWERLGSPAMETHPTISSPSHGFGTLVIVGVYASQEWDTDPGLKLLAGGLRQISTDQQYVEFSTNLQRYMWIPEGIEKPLSQRLKQAFAAVVGTEGMVDTYRSDYQLNGEDPTVIMRNIALMIGAVVLLLGALSLVNITLVSVRQRIREIGVRRAFGATQGRVFFSVMLESIVGTFIAGVVGIIIAILIIQNPWVQNSLISLMFGQGLLDPPPFPMSAAITGLVIAVAVGALAGLIPAIVAVKVKVIDAIRF